MYNHRIAQRIRKLVTGLVLSLASGEANAVFYGTQTQRGTLEGDHRCAMDGARGHGALVETIGSRRDRSAARRIIDKGVTYRLGQTPTSTGSWSRVKQKRKAGQSCSCFSLPSPMTYS